MGWVVPGIVIFFVVVIFIAYASSEDEKKRKKEYEEWLKQQAEDRQRAWNQAQVDLALTCRRCKTMAPPISGTRNRYRCGKCGNQFAAARHNQ